MIDQSYVYFSCCNQVVVYEHSPADFLSAKVYLIQTLSIIDIDAYYVTFDIAVRQ